MNQTLEFALIFNERRRHAANLTMIVVNVWWNMNERLYLFTAHIYKRSHSDHEWSTPEERLSIQSATTLAEAVRKAVEQTDKFLRLYFQEDDASSTRES